MRVNDESLKYRAREPGTGGAVGIQEASIHYAPLAATGSSHLPFQQ
jgi:hypothetical protein